MRRFFSVLIISLIAVSSVIAGPVTYSFNPGETADNALALVREASELLDGIDYEALRPTLRKILWKFGDDADAVIDLGLAGLEVLQDFTPEGSPLLYDMAVSIASALLIDEGDIPAGLTFIDSEVIVSDFDGDWDSYEYYMIGDLLFIDDEFAGYFNDDYSELRVMGVIVYSVS